MRDLTLAIPQTFGRKRSKIESTTKINVLLLVLIAMFGLIYLFTVNSLSTKGYEINKLDQALQELRAEQKRLQVQTSDLQTINRIKEQALLSNFVPATNVTYLKNFDYALK